MSSGNSVGDSHAGAQHFCDLIRPLLEPERKQSLLVAGCGPGHEALHIRKNLGVGVTGIDITQHWDSGYGADFTDFTLLRHSVLDLPFPDNSFDHVFYHHVIEHVSDPAKSLDELRRVLIPGGLIYVGTPNRHRAIGYLGSQGVTTRQKLQWNWIDYKARFRRRFRNEYGAHAGFSERELLQLLDQRFTDVRFLTSEYIHFKYGKRLPGPVVDLICAKPISEVAAAAIYAVARKP